MLEIERAMKCSERLNREGREDLAKEIIDNMNDKELNIFLKKNGYDRSEERL